MTPSAYAAYIADVESALHALLDECRDSQGLSPTPAPVVGLTSEEAS